MGSEEINNIAKISELFQIDKIIFLIISFVLLAGSVRLVGHFISTLSEKIPSKRILFLQVVTIFNFFMYIFGGTILFYSILNPPKELMLAVGGSAAVAIGFSLKDLMASLFAGVILLFDRPFQVGDRVSFGEYYGEIKSLGLRAVRLKTLDDNLVTIPNAKFITDAVASGNAGALDMMIVTDFYVALDADVDLAQDIAYETAVTSRFVYLKKPVSITLTEVEIANRLALRIRVKAYVLDVYYEQSFKTGLTKGVLSLFSKFNIKRPSFSLSMDNEVSEQTISKS
jgi:small-conductance mechanosensitive channel